MPSHRLHPPARRPIEKSGEIGGEGEMTRKEAALLEMVKRGGTLNERRIACEKLMLLTGKDYSYSHRRTAPLAG